MNKLIPIQEITFTEFEEDLKKELENDFNQRLLAFKKSYSWLKSGVSYTPLKFNHVFYKTEFNELKLVLSKVSTILSLDKDCNWEARVVGVITNKELIILYKNSGCDQVELKLQDIEKINDEYVIKCSDTTLIKFKI